MISRETRSACPVRPYDSAEAGYSELVATWLENPNAYFRAFGPEARAFQRQNPSERLRTMTLVGPASRFVGLRPVKVSLDGVGERVSSWESFFAIALARLIAVHASTFSALQESGELAWLGCPRGAAPVADLLEAGVLKPGFGSLEEVVWRTQWLFLMCGIRPNEVVVQVDPYEDEAWEARCEEIHRKRAERRSFLV